MEKENKFEETTKEFFKRRFPNKDIEFEKRVGYFQEWVTRFTNGNPEIYMDDISLKVWEEMKRLIKMTKVKVLCDERDCLNSTELDLNKVKSINWKCEEHRDKEQNIEKSQE